MAYDIHPVILCGGSGTRLWPLSTDETPKQFLALTSDKSMIEETALRFASTEIATLKFSETLVVGSVRHAKLLDEILPAARKILEPFGRNSAPAVAAACLAHAPEDLVLILPADHDIRDVEAFHKAIEVAAVAANDGAIVTFGIEPTHPATGYGYIKVENGTSGPRDVDSFVEKPDLATAESYLAAGSYYWNAGIFLFRVETMLNALQQFAPDVLRCVKESMSGTPCDNTIPLNRDAFARTPSISIDYAVMEKAANVKTVPVNMGWSDVGGYLALHQLLTSDPTDNYASGPVHIQNSKGLYVHSEGPTISVNGVADLIIVATQNDVMITPKDDDAAVKELGNVAQNARGVFGLSTGICEKARDWLWTAFEVWAEKAWDPVRGGFVEQLDMNGNPDYDANRRVRVQARQIFSYAKSIEMGWPEAEVANAIIQKGADFFDSNLRHADGGFVHLISPDQKMLDDRRDLYDHAFILLAGSAAFKSTGNSTALKIAEDALKYINENLKDDRHGGWFESNLRENPRRANPHMHLLEALLEYHSATGSAAALRQSAEIVKLFETKFFFPAIDVTAEFFSEDWSLTETESLTVWEPGHHFEWATLLKSFDEAVGHDTLTYRRRMMRRAIRSGINSQTGFALNAVRADNTPLNTNSRLWHQLEMFRAQLVHPEIANSTQTEALLKRIFEEYLDPGPTGGWVDELSKDGDRVSQFVPASMLYHAVTAFLPLATP